MFRTDIAIDTILSHPPLEVFDEQVVRFLSQLSNRIKAHPDLRKYPDLASFGFFIRKKNLIKLEKFHKKENKWSMGIGTAFHIAPSNVPLNFAYSLVAALLCGNPSIVRISSKIFEQSELLIKLMNEELKHGKFTPFFTILQYNRDQALNRKLSSECRIRLLWGGDQTIELFKSFNVKPNGVDITFPDRYSLSLIDAKTYNEISNTFMIAAKFYNDVYTFDQNACTSPRGIFWLGEKMEITIAKKNFWSSLNKILKEKKYAPTQGVGVRHLADIANLAARDEIQNSDNFSHYAMQIFDIKNGTANIFREHGGEGLFYQKNITQLNELKPFINEKCQTLSILAKKREHILDWIVSSGLTGIDRVCNVGDASEFNLHWDGKDLFHLMTKRLVA